ncbi:MAG: DUF262 domain-containing protein [Anaerolineaceae bacterium]|nr:DUF262 domain-containing protein [Anaerolineaceae bacterium]
MRTINFTIKDILNRAKSEQFRIPQFQRKFRWQNSQVKLLVDSVARNYPIGSLLMLSQNPEVPLRSRPIEAEIRDITPDDNDDEMGTEIYYVLDGQQRLTSIARIFLNSDPKKNYYFDLKSMLNGFEREDDTAWIVSRQKGKNDPKRKDNNRLLRADVALEQKETDIFVTEYIEDSGDFPEFQNDKAKAREAAAQIKGIFETIRKYQVPIVVLDRDAPLESVCRIFETINSTGTRLTTFDLAVARFYPSPDLRNLWEKAQEDHSILKEFDVDGERVLQLLSLWNSYEQKTFSEPTRSKLLSLSANFITNNWDDAITKLSEAYKWAKENGATSNTLPTHGLLVSLAAFLAVFPNFLKSPTANHMSVLRRWYFAKILQQGAGQAANYKIGLDFDVLVRYAEEDIMPGIPDVKLGAEALRRIHRTSDSRYKALHCIMVFTAKEDLFSGNGLYTEIEDHHIYPRALGKTEGFNISELDSIANRILISQNSNRILGDKLPEIYFGDLQDKAIQTGTEGDTNRRLKSCLIPGDVRHLTFKIMFSLQNFEIFLNDRANLLLSRVEELIGKSLIITSTPDDDDEFD